MTALRVLGAAAFTARVVAERIGITYFTSHAGARWQPFGQGRAPRPGGR